MALHLGNGAGDGAKLVRLMNVLADTYDKRALQRFARSIGLNVNAVDWDGPPLDAADSLITYANARWLLDTLIQAAYADNKDNADLRAFAVAVGLLQPTSQPLPPNVGAEQAVRGMLESTYFDLNTLLAVLPKAVDAAQAVCRIRIPVRLNNQPKFVYGTGFLLAPDLLLTCYHVAQPLIAGTVRNDPGPALAVDGGPVDPQAMDLEFGYQTDAAGVAHPPPPYKLAATKWLVASSPYDALDYALLRVAGAPGTAPREGVQPPTTRGWLAADLAYTFAANDPLYALEHPILPSDTTQGAPLKLTAPQHAVYSAPPGPPPRVLYAVDTEEGASGSPCFNRDFRLVALHHAGTAGHAGLNEGIPIKAILHDLAAQPPAKAALDAAGVATT